MKITALTCTFERPEAFKLCEKYLSRQTRQPDQWLVLDGPEPMREKVMKAITAGQIEGDAILFVEDDDAYQSTWIEWCEKYLAQYDIVGQGNALYYHAGQRWWSECHNTRHASLCQTGIRKEMLPLLLNLMRAFDNQFFDTRLWRLDKRRFLDLPDDAHRLVIGMKGLPGKLGYSNEHRPEIPPNVQLDPALFKLWRLIGADAAAYLPFYHP